MITRFLVGLSGAHPEILDQCPTERPKFQNLGWVIFISAVLAMVSIWLMLASEWSLNSVLAFVITLAWGFIIIGIDRWLVTSIPAYFPARLVVAAPRIILAMLLGAVISFPIVLQIFQPQINAEITVIRQQQTDAFVASQRGSAVNKAINSWHGDVNNLEAVINARGNVPANPNADPEIQSLIKQRNLEMSLENHSYHQWQCLLSGGTGCPARNVSLAQANENSYNQAKTQVRKLTAEIQQRQAQLDHISATSAQTRYRQAISELPKARQQLNADTALESKQLNAFDVENNANRGFLLDLQALNQLSNKNSTVSTTSILLFLLFLIIATLPVIVKLTQRPGIYETILQETAERELADAKRAAVINVISSAASSDHNSDSPELTVDQTSKQSSTAIDSPRRTSIAEGGSRDADATTDENSSGRGSAPSIARPAESMTDRNNPLPDVGAADTVRGHAFISYVREDSRHADRLQHRLEDAGIPVWRDTAKLWPGEDWRMMIRRAITDDALVFIACFSHKSLARKKSYQNEELALAIEQLRSRRPDLPWLIPVRFDDCEVPDYDVGPGRTLRSIHRADLFGRHAKEGATRLVAVVLRILGPGETS